MNRYSRRAAAARARRRLVVRRRCCSELAENCGDRGPCALRSLLINRKDCRAIAAAGIGMEALGH
jgi:hypothetical protein